MAYCLLKLIDATENEKKNNNSLKFTVTKIMVSQERSKLFSKHNHSRKICYDYDKINTIPARLEQVHRQHDIEMLQNYPRQQFDWLGHESKMVSLQNRSKIKIHY